MEAFDAGGVDYVTKPFEAREVLARVATHLKISRLQQELEAQNAELNAFAHTVAHDLKSPLSIVQGYTSMMLEDLSNILTEDGVKYVQRIQDGALKASKIIDELLLLAGIGRQQVEITAVNMHEPVALALDRLQMRIQEYQPEIIKPETWPKAKGYSPWIEEVWANYISNALKYGGQSPRVELGSTPLGNGLIQFWVQDNGPGLTSEEQAKLFAEFSRINTDRAQGHGLGLSIVRRIVRRLGGEVGVESQPGQGSKFYFTLPAA
jgi:signal transduction histidine kinase